MNKAVCKYKPANLNELKQRCKKQKKKKKRKKTAGQNSSTKMRETDKAKQKTIQVITANGASTSY